MIYKKCTRCGIKLKRTRMIHKRISFSGGKLMKHKYAFCRKHVGTKSFMEAKWADHIHQLMPDHNLLFGEK